MTQTLLSPNLSQLTVETKSDGSADVAIFIRSLHGGGAERVMLNIAHGLAEQGFKVDLLLARKEGQYLAQVSPKVRIVDLKSPQVMRSLLPLMRYLNRVQPSCMLAALHYPCEIAVLAKHLTRVNTRIVVSERNTLSLEARGIPQLSVRLTPLAARLFYPLADGIIAISKGVANDLAQITHLSPEKIDVIYNPTLTPDLKTKATAPVTHPWFSDNTIPVVLAVGRLHPQKDFPTLIRAFERLRQHQAARLMILGTGPEAKNLQRLIDQKGLSDDVVLFGFVNNPYAYMAKADVFVLSSAWEGVANVLVEAMAVGTAIVSTDCQSGPAEVLNQGEYGFLVPVGDSKAMANAIAFALTEGTRPATKAWLHQFTPEVCLQKYISVLGLNECTRMEGSEKSNVDRL